MAPPTKSNNKGGGSPTKTSSSASLTATGGSGGGGEWTGTTNPLWNVGENAVWDYLDMQFDVTRPQLEAGGKLVVVVLNKHTVYKDKVIGQCMVDLTEACGDMGKVTVVRGMLAAINDDGKHTERQVDYP